jgi:hypothetical protein
MADQSKPAAAGEKTLTGHVPATTESLSTPDAPQEKRRYSRRMRGMQELERGMSKAGASLGDAVAATFNSYKDRSRKSSFKKRDGAVKDALKELDQGLQQGHEASQ